MHIKKFLCSHFPLRKLFGCVVPLMLALTVSVVNAQIWEDFTVWYDGNGADSGHIYEVHYKSGSNDVTLKENAAESGSADVPYVKNGCSFQGWSLSPDGGSVITPILPGGTVWDPVDVPVTWMEDKKGFVFYARWDCGAGYVPSPIPATSTPAATSTQVPMATQTPVKTAVPTSTTVPTSVPVQFTVTPSLLISPNGRRASVDSTASQPQGATPTPSLLIFPRSRVQTVGKDGSDAETELIEMENGLLIGPVEASDDSESKRILPLFSSSDGELLALPETGITTRSGFHRSEMPASVSYAPTRMELQIPSLEMISDIVFVEHDENGYPIQWLEMDTGLLADTAIPGEGFTVIAGHNTLNAEEFGPFALINALRKGDRFFIRTDRNELMIFEVYSNEKINEYDYEALYQSGAQFENTVTLLTCEDERPEGGYTNRRIVSARKIN